MPPTYTDSQIQAIETDARDICVAAGAGSGKTGVLVQRFVRLITQSRLGELPPELRAGVDQILVITFTEKATKEMKARIVADLTRLNLTDERRQLETAFISTIHGFCSRLLQENPFEVGIDPHFVVLEEPQARRLLRQTVESVIARAYRDGDEESTELVATVQALRQSGEEQADPVASLAASVEVVLAKLRGSGRRRDEIERHWKSGLESTSTQSEQAIWGAVTPIVAEILAFVRDVEPLRSGLTGTARGLCDKLLLLGERIGACGAQGETLTALREMYQSLRGTRASSTSPTAIGTRFSQCIGRLKASCEAYTPLFDADLPDPNLSALTCHRMWGLTVEVWRAYDEEKRRRGRLDNEDLQLECLRLLEDFPEVLDRYRRRLRYLMVDEFQDTNSVQMRIIDLLHVREHPESPSEDAAAAAEASISPGPPRNYLFVVGDAQQSIYGFRGAEPALFRALERRYRENGSGVHVPLRTNFRSRPEILRLIATLFRQIWRSELTPFVSLEPGAPFDAISKPCVELLVTADLIRQDYLGVEPAALALRIRQLVDDGELRLGSRHDPRSGQLVRYRDIAVLLRQLTDIQRYEEAFTRAGVPYFVVGGGRGYYARQEIRDLLNILTVLETPLNDVALMAALRSPIVGADVDTLYRIVEAADGLHQTNDRRNDLADAPAASSAPPSSGKRNRQVRLPLYVAMRQLLDSRSLPLEEDAKVRLFADVMDSLRAQQDRMPVGHLIERLIARTSYDARLLCRPNGRRRLANVRKLLQMANSEPVLGVGEFIRRLRDLEKLSDREGDAPTEEEEADVVRFHTIHGAKGLEFPVVILADLCRSLEHSEHGLFVCDPHRLAIGTRICGGSDSVYRAVDHARQQSDREEADRLLYVAMTRAREYLVLCGNLGRNRGMNWGDRLFTALGVNEAPPQPIVRTLIGGVEALLAPLVQDAGAAIVGATETAARQRERSAARYADRLAEAILSGQPVESVMG